MYIKTRKKDEGTITKNAYSEETGANQTKGAIVEAEKKKEAGLSWGAFFSFICLVFRLASIIALFTIAFRFTHQTLRSDCKEPTYIYRKADVSILPHD